jgi:hypothetical protein
LLSPQLFESDAEVLGIRTDLRLREVAVEHRAYLAWHRESWFRG